MKEKNSINRNSVLVFLAAAALRAVCYLQPVVHQFRNDDFGPISYAAYLAGYDWSSFIKGIRGYYGFGFYWIFAPLFRLTDSPKLLLIAINAVNGVLMALSAVLIYRLLVKYMRFPADLMTMVFALLPTMFQGDAGYARYWYRTDNEIPLYYACWLTVLMLLLAQRSLMENRKVRTLLAVLMSLLMCWSLTVHERALALVMAVLFAEIFLFLSKRKWLFQPAAFFGTFAVGFFAQRMLRRAVILALWAGGGPKKNTSAFSRVSLWFLESFGAFKTFLIVFFGNMHSLMIKGFGLPVIALVLVTIWIVKQLPVLRKKFFAEDDAVKSEWVGPEMLIMVVFGMCILITITGLAVRWGTLLFPGIADNEIVYGYKGINYNRYYYTFIGPLLFGILAYCRNHRPFTRGLTEAVWAVLVGIEMIFFVEIFPYCVRADAEAGTNYVKRALGTYILKDKTPEIGMVISMFLMAAVMICITLAVREGGSLQRSLRSLGVAAAIGLAVFALDRAEQIDPKGPSLNFGDAEIVTEAMAALEAAGKVPENVYLPYDNWSFTVIYMDKSQRYWDRDPLGDQLLEDNLVWNVKDVPGYYVENDYEMIKYRQFYAYTNNHETYELLQDFFDNRK